VTVSLSDSEKGALLWGETYDRDLTTQELFALEDNLTNAVIARVGDVFGAIPRLLARESRGKPADTLQTYEAIQRFISYMGSLREEDYHEARKALEIASQKEPDFAPVWSALSILFSVDFMLGYSGRDGLAEHSWELANRAVSLDGASSSAHLSRCVSAYVNKNREAVISEGEKAIALNPNAVALVGFSANLIGMAGEMTRGISILEEVDKLNPFYPSWLLGLRCLDYYMRNSYDEALELAGRFTHDAWTGKPLYTAAILGQLGDRRQASMHLRNLERLDPRFAVDPQAYLRQRYFFDDQVEKILDGLVKAGL
jgi:tetratricopeptide (TPR) repeat protein